MKTQMIKTIVVGMVVSATVLCVSRAQSQDKPAAPQPQQQQPAMPDMQEMMRKWLAAATPGEKHKLLDPLVGQWETTTRIWMAGPDAPPTETQGKASIKWVLDKHFLLQEFAGEMLMPDASGQVQKVPQLGLGLTGYDNYRNVYVATWADNAGTAILTMSGGADPSGKVFTLYGEMDEPMLDVRGRTVKFVTTLKDKDNFILEIFDLHAGPNYKVVEVAYKRK